MANELEHVDATGKTIYAKATPVVESPWSTGLVTMAEVGGTGYYSADVGSPVPGYVVYEQAGGTAVVTDEKVGVIHTVVAMDLSQSVAVANPGNTVGDCLNGARAQAFGRWRLDESAKTLTIYGPDDSTAILVFDITPDTTTPLNRVPQ